MALPIKYSYSGSDCKAVAFYSNVDDYAYYVKDIKDFFVYTATGQEEPTSLSSNQLKEIFKTPTKLPRSGNDYFDWGFQDEEKFDGTDASAAEIKSFLAGQRQRKLAEKKVQERAKKASSIIPLDSLATISYSIHEAKSPVRRLGERGVNGYTRGIRTIAGSMIFLVIEDHPLARLIELERKSKNWSSDLHRKGHSFRTVKKGKEDPGYTNFISTILEPFNIGLFYKTEVQFGYSSKDESSFNMRKSGYIRTGDDGAHLVISGIDIISEGMVTSVNDMVTEVTIQFVAQDVFNIEKVNNWQTTTTAVKAQETGPHESLLQSKIKRGGEDADQ